MADPNFEPYPSKIPDSREWDYRRDREDRVYAGGAPCVVTVYGPQGRGRDDCHDGHHHNEPFPPPATLPLSGNEQMNLWQFIAPFTGRLSRVVTGVLDFIRSFWPTPFTWANRNATADTPTVSMFTVGSIDMAYRLVWNIACKVQDAGASTGTLTINFTPRGKYFPPGGGALTTGPITATCNLTTAGDGESASIDVMLAAGSTVSFDFTGGGTYGAAQYGLIVSAIPQSSDKPVNATGNVMY